MKKKINVKELTQNLSEYVPDWKISQMVENEEEESIHEINSININKTIKNGGFFSAR